MIEREEGRQWLGCLTTVLGLTVLVALAALIIALATATLTWQIVTYNPWTTR